MIDNARTGKFFKQLFGQVRYTLLLLAIVSLVYVYFMQFVDHEITWVSYIIIFLAFLKTSYFTFFTFKQVSRSIEGFQSFKELLWVYGFLILIVVFSYATDFTCLISAYKSSFLIQGIIGPADRSHFELFFESLYFSMVTFASIGYGDIVPLSLPAKILVMMEISQSFVMVVFTLSNINIRHSNIES